MTGDTYSVLYVSRLISVLIGDLIEGAKSGICLSSILPLIAPRDLVIHTSNDRSIAEKASGRARVRFECGVYCIVYSETEVTIKEHLQRILRSHDIQFNQRCTAYIFFIRAVYLRGS
ncbi:uncharacterized protein RAG0_08570 [Rhynchosporium agropyri]|uniref:Uncharacterized protein n=1 Tax=Rhynchosporium agropyri TaxID=914238 RepID=A0A1E1KRG6_9HELO|nr:uncharacterized protein RAG0_08570 [Rhynchosporium agropyri]